ncbi:FadR family transcriptional regulator [Plantibacter sp. MCCC 1A11337]|uniref:FadR/GntR family transcriptional regulator n=1 Tax=Plantibacter sp. MCCC 1A11337 TaxID=2736644 RepID=UPI001582777D|nr:FadR family transcriptional regulator [Plantibacter sp. MCCC 1A11337]
MSRAPGTSAFERTLDRIGTDIVDGGLPAGTVCTVDELVDRAGHSRSVVREATRVLAGMGLLASKAHVGHTVQPSSSWDWLQPRVLRWALASGQRESTLLAIRELRTATEPESARLAAERRSDDDARDLRETSEALRSAAARQDPIAFLEADLLLHRLIRRAAANPILDRVGDAVDEALRDRVDRLPGDGIDHHDAALHTDLASAIEAQDGERAAATMRVIILRTA